MKTIKVVAAIIIDNGKVFATQRGYGEFKDGWEFPGGKIEEGETAREAIVREIRENWIRRFRWKNFWIPWSMIIRSFICRWIASSAL